MERRIAVVLMASGYSERFGSNKLLEPFGNRCLFTYAVDLACASDAAMKIIVTRYEPIKHYVKENAPKILYGMTIRNVEFQNPFIWEFVI